MERVTELKVSREQERRECHCNSTAAMSREQQGRTWCPTVFLWSLFGAFGAGFAERTLILEDLDATASSFSWKRSATSWNWKETKPVQCEQSYSLVAKISISSWEKMFILIFDYPGVILYGQNKQKNTPKEFKSVVCTYVTCLYDLRA